MGCAKENCPKPRSASHFPTARINLDDAGLAEHFSLATMLKNSLQESNARLHRINSTPPAHLTVRAGKMIGHTDSSQSITIISSTEGRVSTNLCTNSGTMETTPTSFDGEYSQASSALSLPSTSPLPSGYSFLSKSTFSRPSNPHLIRQTSDSRIQRVASNRIAEGRHELRHSFRWSGSSGGESSVGSSGCTSDWWSVQAFSDLVASSRMERLRWTNASSPSDFGLGSTCENVERGLLVMEKICAGGSRTSSPPSRAESHVCGVCSRLLTQWSPWSSSRMAGSSDCTAVGVLVCGHVYHADCLEHVTPEARQQDPLCPRCGAGEKSLKQTVERVEPVTVAKGGALLKVSTTQLLARNKLSRIGVTTDDIAGRENTCLDISREMDLPLKPFVSDKLFSGKSSSRSQLSFRRTISKEPVAADAVLKNPGSPARVAPVDSSDNQCQQTQSQPRRQPSSFRYLRRW